jgi:hypothetical protein
MTRRIEGIGLTVVKDTQDLDRLITTGVMAANVISGSLKLTKD